MPKGGKRKGAGRKKGIPNKVTQDLRERLLASGESPLEFLTRMYRAPEPTIRFEESPLAFVARHNQWDHDRLEAAKSAAPFYHSKLSTIEHKGAGGGPIQHRFEIEFVQSGKPR
ncbi:MAG: hypothetical protein ABIQ41_08050 [Gemmatimonadales bacterium]